MQYSCRVLRPVTLIATARGTRFLSSPSDKFLNLHGDSEGSGPEESWLPAIQATALSHSHRALFRPWGEPCHSMFGFSGHEDPCSQSCYEYKSLIDLSLTAERRRHLSMAARFEAQRRRCRSALCTRASSPPLCHVTLPATSPSNNRRQTLRPPDTSCRAFTRPPTPRHVMT